MQGWDGISGDSKKAYFAKLQWKHFFAFTNHTKYTKVPYVYTGGQRYFWLLENKKIKITAKFEKKSQEMELYIRSSKQKWGRGA